MQQQWVVKSLTIWGLIITIMTAVIPVAGVLSPDISGTLTPEWITGLNDSVVKAINAIGVLVGSVMVLIDRLRATGEVKKTLVLRNPD